MQPALVLSRLQALHEALDRAGFEHAVGGAIALSVHAEPRATTDMDLNVIADPEHPQRLLDTMPDGVVIHPSAAAELRRDGQVRLIWPHPDTPVDLFLPQHPEFHRLVNDRARPDIEQIGFDIRVISATDLMVFKMLFNRTKDWADIESLLRAGAGDPDEAADWIVQFLGPDDERLTRLDDARRAAREGYPVFRFPAQKPGSSR
ncbi:MAG: hypothetical protein QM733_19120 [Ilumatobacteraceae bacterium]